MIFLTQTFNGVTPMDNWTVRTDRCAAVGTGKTQQEALDSLVTAVNEQASYLDGFAKELKKIKFK